MSKASVNLIAILNFTPKIYPIGKLHAERLLESSRPRRPSPDTAGPLESLSSGFLTRAPVHRRLSCVDMNQVHNQLEVQEVFRLKPSEKARVYMIR